MRKLRRFMEISPGERRLLCKVWPALCLVRLALWLLPFRTCRKLVSSVGTPALMPESAAWPPERVAWAVRAAARYVPGGSCLTQAMTAQMFLSRQGHPSRLRFGVESDKEGGFRAHAWVESDGKVVIGGDDLDRFVELSAPSESSLH